jgi:opacity protein-like surface antigen
MKNLTAKLTTLKSTAVRAVAGMALAGAVLAAAPAAQAQRVFVGVGGPRFFAPAPRVVVAPPAYYGHAYYGSGFYGYHHDDWRFHHDYYRHGWR